MTTYYIKILWELWWIGKSVKLKLDEWFPGAGTTGQDWEEIGY